MIDLNGIRLRNRIVSAATFLGYGAKPKGSVLGYGTSPVGRFLDMRRFGAVTVRTLTLEPREGQFTLKEDWNLWDFPQMMRRYRQVLRPIDSGWLNAFGWCNIGIERYFAEYYPRTMKLNRIISLGGFSVEEFCELVDYVNSRAGPGEIAAVEFNISCHNVNFDFEAIVVDVLNQAVERSRHPVILKISPDVDYIHHSRLAEDNGVAAISAMNTVKGLRLNPVTGRPLLSNVYGGMSGRAIKPIGLRVVAELRRATRLPIIAGAGIRNYDDCREYFWAGASAVSLGSEVFLASWPGYLLAPLKARRLMRLVSLIERKWTDWVPEPPLEEPVSTYPVTVASPPRD